MRILLHLQPLATQRFVAAQAQRLGDALVCHAGQVRFSLPDQVLVASDEAGPSFVPAGYRDHLIRRASLLDWFSRTDLRRAVSQRLQDLELAASREASIGAKLLRYALVIYLVQELLPAGRTVQYVMEDNEEISTRPIDKTPSVGLAFSAATETVAEAACCFYLPQWVAFDEHDRLLVKSAREAEAHLTSMQCFMDVLILAQALALYIVVDEQYRQKYYGMLAQVVNQGRALARHETKAIIAAIKDRAARHELDQGLRLSVPYFDDQTLSIRFVDFEVIPVGRIMFVPAFIVKAAREEQIKVAADTRLSPSTRQHLLHELKLLERAFDDGAAEQYRAWQQVYEQPPGVQPSWVHVTSK